MTIPSKPARYHHGDLRAALLQAAERVLGETGLDAFSLRRVAKEVGVSHAAPAHHFSDVEGLLTALAAEAFRRFVQAMEARQRDETAPMARLQASGLGYLDFARERPALFRLMFGWTRVIADDPALEAAAEAAWRHLADGVAAVRGAHPDDDPSAHEAALGVWATVHGLAELMSVGDLKMFAGHDGPARDAMVRRMVAQAVAV